MNVLHLSLSKSFDLSIFSKDPMKNSTLGYFRKSTWSQMHRKLQPMMEDDYCVPFFKCKFFIPTWLYIFCSPKPSKIYGESDFESSVSRNMFGKYTFSGSKKILLFLMVGKYKWIFPKNMLSSSLLSYLLTYLLTYFTEKWITYVTIS